MNIYRGDMIYIAKGNTSTVGSEQSADRPAVVVSNDKCNEYSSVIDVVYLTSAKKTPLPTHVPVMCSVPSIALCEQIHSISKNRVTGYIRSCTESEMSAIDRGLMVSLGIEVSDDAMVDELKAKIGDQITYIQQLEVEAENLRNAGDTNVSTDMAKYMAEARIYKEQYEKLLQKLLER